MLTVDQCRPKFALLVWAYLLSWYMPQPMSLSGLWMSLWSPGGEYLALWILALGNPCVKGYMMSHRRGWYGQSECLQCHCQLSVVALDTITLDAVALPPTPVALDAITLPPTPVAVDAVAVEFPTHCCANRGGPTVLLDLWNTCHSHWKGRVCSAVWTCWHMAWLVTC